MADQPVPQPESPNIPVASSPEPAPAQPPQTTATSDTPTNPPVNPPAATTMPKKSHGKMMWLLLLVVLIVAGVVVWYVMKHHTTTKKVTTTVTKQDIPLLVYANENNPFNVYYPNDAVIHGPLEIEDQVYEGLVQFTNGKQVVPDLAASWTNPNNTTWVFKLKPNVYYHDGDVVTAQDVVYSWQQVKANTQVLASYATSTIKNVQALDSQTVQITTTAPDPVLLNRLTDLWIIDSKAPAGTQPLELGTGAYTLKSGTTPTADSVDLVAFSKWHGGHIYTKELDSVFYASPAQALTAIEAGKVDMTNALSVAQAKQAVKANPNLAIDTEPGIYVDFLSFNTTTASSPTANPKIREAIDLTLNPADILAAYGVSGTPADQVIPPQIPGYNPAIKRPAINLTEAKQLVTAAGYPNGVTINLGIGEPAEANGQEMAKELAPIGITLKLDVATDEGTFFGNINSGVYQTWFQGDGTNITDASDVLAYWQKAPFYDNATFDAELTKANQTFDATTRLTELQQASQTLLTDNAYIPLFQHSVTLVAKKGVVFPLGLYNDDVNTYYSDVYQQGE